MNRRTQANGHERTSSPESYPALHWPLHLLRHLCSVCDGTHKQHAGRLPDLSML